MEQNKYDTIYRRLFAKIIDYTLIGIILKVFSLIFIPQTTYSINFDVQDGQNPIIENPNDNLNFWIEYGELTTALLLILYFIIFNYFFGQTIGKMITSVKIWNIDETTKLSFGQALLRNIPDLIYALIIFFISYEYLPFALIAIWNITNLFQVFSNKKYRTINDLIAKTVVLKIQQEKLIITDDKE